jgi:hypothetical protein
VIVAAAHRIANDPNLPEPQFIPHPATWLDRAGWEDAPYPDRHTGKLATTDQRVLDGAAIVARLQAIERGELTNTSPFQIGASHDTI